MKQLVAFLISLIAFSLATPTYLHAQCINKENRVAYTYGNKNGKKEYKISVQSSGIPSGFTSEELKIATMQAAAIWNEQGNAAYWEFTGLDYVTDLPVNLADCISLGLDFNLLVFEERALGNGQLGREVGRCLDGNNVSHYSVMYTYKSNPAPGGSFNWGGAGLTSGQFDIIHHLAHEMGHSLSLDHPTGSIYAVMRTTAGETGQTRRRELYKYDIDCEEQLAGVRQTGGYYSLFFNGGLSSAIKWTNNWTLSKGTIGSDSTLSHINFFVNGDENGGSDQNSIWTKFANESNENVFMTNGAKMAFSPTAMSFKDDTSNRDFVYYNNGTAEYPINYNATSSRRLIRRYSSAFETSNSSELFVRRCNGMSSSSSCSNSINILTVDRPSYAWNDWLNQSHFLWLETDKSNPSNHKKIQIASGQISDSVFPEPVNLNNARSAVTPGLACKSFDAGGYDCIIAYVDPDDSLATISVERFYIDQPGTYHAMNREGTIYTVDYYTARTHSPIAAWWHDGDFYIAFRSAETGQPVRVWKSDEGDSWTQLGSVSIDSFVGPSALPQQQGNSNYLSFFY